MTTFRVTAYEAIEPGMRFEPWWEDGDRPTLRRVIELELDGASPEEAAEAAFLIGQKEPELTQNTDYEWPADRRSMSVGDVLVIDGDMALGCAPAGWCRVDLTPEQMEGARA